MVLIAEGDPRTPDVTVISTSLNLGRFLAETLDSVSMQSGVLIEHLVVDGGSTDQSIKILSENPFIRWISEPDRNYSDAFLKGLRLARGQIIAQCAVSDGYIDKDWLHNCVSLLDSSPQIAAVWGFPQTTDEAGNLGKVSYTERWPLGAPSGTDFFEYWLKTQFHMPEGNICARRGVIETCFPMEAIIDNGIEPWLEFNYQFHTRGYLAAHIPVVANFGRMHGGSIGQIEIKTRSGPKKYRRYLRKCSNYQFKTVLLGQPHDFKEPLNRAFIRSRKSERLAPRLMKFIRMRTSQATVLRFVHLFILNGRPFPRALSNFRSMIFGRARDRKGD